MFAKDLVKAGGIFRRLFDCQPAKLQSINVTLQELIHLFDCVGVVDVRFRYRMLVGLTECCPLMQRRCGLGFGLRIFFVGL